MVLNIFPQRKIYKQGEPIKLIHHCTPWRGLNVVLRAMQEIKNPNITLDVYSSTQVYGDAFKTTHMMINLNRYMNKRRELPNVNYIGYKSNEYIIEVMPSYDMFVYPSIFEETSCVSALEALSMQEFMLLQITLVLYMKLVQNGQCILLIIQITKPWLEIQQQQFKLQQLFYICSNTCS
jgi:glycosyltransferase involved in cell wall biosynthesis